MLQRLRSPNHAVPLLSLIPQSDRSIVQNAQNPRDLELVDHELHAPSKATGVAWRDTDPNRAMMPVERTAREVCLVELTSTRADHGSIERCTSCNKGASCHHSVPCQGISRWWSWWAIPPSSNTTAKWANNLHFTQAIAANWDNCFRECPHQEGHPGAEDRIVRGGGGGASWHSQLARGDELLCRAKRRGDWLGLGCPGVVVVSKNIYF